MSIQEAIAKQQATIASTSNQLEKDLLYYRSKALEYLTEINWKSPANRSNYVRSNRNSIAVFAVYQTGGTELLNLYMATVSRK